MHAVLQGVFFFYKPTVIMIPEKIGFALPDTYRVSQPVAAHMNCNGLTGSQHPVNCHAPVMEDKLPRLDDAQLIRVKDDSYISFDCHDVRLRTYNNTNKRSRKPLEEMGKDQRAM